MPILSTGEVAALLVAASHEGADDLTVKLVAQSLPQYDYVSVCAFVVSLEGAGYIQGIRRGRVKLLNLTPKGKEESVRQQARYVLVDVRNLPCHGCSCSNHPLFNHP